MLIALAIETGLLRHIMGIRGHGGKGGWFTLVLTVKKTHGATD